MLFLFEKQEKLVTSCMNYLFPFLTLQVHKQSAENKVKVDKTTTSEKPRQLYWEKRLSGNYFDFWKNKNEKIIIILLILGLRPSYPKESFEPFELPKNFKPIGPRVANDNVVASTTTSLHMNSGAIVRQKSSKLSFWYVNSI